MDLKSVLAKPFKALPKGLLWQFGIAAAVLAAGLLISLITFFQYRHWEFERARAEFEQASQNRVMALKKVLEADLLSLRFVVTFYDSSDAVAPHEFTCFAAQLLGDNASMSSLQWAPRVEWTQKGAFERDARINGFPDFKILEARDDASPDASGRQECFPIFYVESQKPLAALSGYDLASVPACLEAMRTARDTGQFAATREIIFPGQDKSYSRVWAFLPIYEKKATLHADTLLGSTEDRRKYLQGFAVETISIEGIVSESLKTLMPVGIDLYVFYSRLTPDAKVLHFHASRISRTGCRALDLENIVQQAPMSSSDSLDIAGQKWAVLCIPSPQFISGRITWQPWVIGIACLLLTGLLAWYLATIAVRNQRTAHLAAILAATNHKLKSEITDRRSAEETSQRENAKLAAMISAMEEGVAFADANNSIIEINNYLCQFVGKPREEIIGKRIEDLHPAEVLDRILAQIAMFRNEVVPGPFVLQCPLGGKEVILRMQPIYRHGTYDGVLLNIIDVSELVEARRQAEAANKSKSKFLATMSHEMRTPMAAILGYNDLLMDPKIDASTRNNYLMVVRRNAEKLLLLINDILDLSKIEAGKMTLNVERCNLVSMLADVAGMMRPRAELRGDVLSIEYLTALPETILTDGNRLRQAIVNIVGNAVKFTANGQVRVKVSFLPQWRESGPAVKIDVVDTGVGIAEDVLPRLFQPFNQGDAATSQKYGGTGLGLAISKHILQLLHGDITVNSARGAGSTFTITVPSGDLKGVKIFQKPMEIMEGPAAEHQPRDSNILSGLKILLAEDNPDNQEFIRIILTRAGAQVAVAENGRVAVDKALAEFFDVILMDINMPEMDGYEATRLLRSRGYDRPILALTANVMAEDRQRCLAAGYNDHLGKPVDRAQMLLTIAWQAGRIIPEAADLSPQDGGDAHPADETEIISIYADDPDIVPILEGYVARLQAQVDDMRAALGNAQFVDLQRLAHRLKGSGGNYGYPMLTEAAGKLEEAAKARDLRSAGEALHRIALLCQAIERGFAKYNAGAMPS